MGREDFTKYPPIPFNMTYVLMQCECCKVCARKEMPLNNKSPDQTAVMTIVVTEAIMFVMLLCMLLYNDQYSCSDGKWSLVFSVTVQ